jgi:NADPH:quinone reductase-like Zn-dependent oxidoreductase
MTTNQNASSNSPDEQSKYDISTGHMRAIVQDSYGSADVLELRTIKRPSISDTQVLIEVRAAGVDRGVWHLMTGQPYLVRLAGYGIRKPKNPVPGLDVAGTVVAVGSAVTRFKSGDEVFGVGSSTYAEYAAADEHKISHRPASITAAQAAAASISGITALQALTDVGDVQPGQRVLVLGASGGVGSFAVQLAKALGAEVTGVASTAKVDLVTSLGADHVIDYTRHDFVDDSILYDLIIDTGGRNKISKLRSALTPRGTLVIVGGEDGGRWTGGVGRQIRATVLSLFVRQRLAMFLSKEHHSFIDRLAAFMESGAVVSAVGREFSLEETPEAIRALESGETRGKAVIAVRPADDDRAS